MAITFTDCLAQCKCPTLNSNKNKYNDKKITANTEPELLPENLKNI